MNLFEILKAVLYGIVEGISEWLPISSTGHLLLLERILPLDVSPAFWNMFLVVVQLGAILAVCLLFFHDLNPFAGDKTDREKRNTWSLWAKIVVACIPAAAVGIPLDDWMEEHLGSPFIIAGALIVYGILFILIENLRAKRARERLATRPRSKHLKAPSTAATVAELADEDARIHSMEELDWPTVLGIGCFQVLSLIPGTSRSGSTIIGGLILGCSREVAATFTFYLAVPVMFGASGLRLVKFFLDGNSFAPGELTILLVGAVTAFVVSIIVIRFLLSFIRKHDFKPFGVYRILLGIVVIAYFLINA